MDVLTGFASNVARDLVVGVVKQLRYPCCFNDFVKELEDKKDSLEVRRIRVEDRIAQTKKQTKKPDEEMDKWLEDANRYIAEVDELLEKAKTKKSCLPYCPNWFCRYYLGRKLEDKKGKVENHTRDGGDPCPRLDRFTTLANDTPSEDYLNFGSRESAYEQLMGAVTTNNNIQMIVLYGMGGCGKTTMAEQVQKEAIEKHLFDKVLFVPVPKEVKVRRIQDIIASSLSYDFPPAEKEERERALRLKERLTEENNILVILDDVWQKLPFKTIGIPSPNDHKGCCKVLITTRNKNVFREEYRQIEIELRELDNDEAWRLFQNQAGDISELGTSVTSRERLLSVARQISDECKGLPVAIAALAGTLKGKAEGDWNTALNRLRSSEPVNIEPDLLDPYKCLRLSYYNLEDNQEAKSLLLLCSVFPNEISFEQLTRFAIGLGVVRKTVKYEDARDEVITAKNKLVRSCLLFDVGNGKRVKMHDLVRDVVRWIAKEEKKAIMYKSENDDTTLEEHNGSIRYLMCEKFPNELDCSNLEFLLIGTELEVSHEVFQKMGNLRVLLLSNSEIYPRTLSTISFRSLTNLRYLYLQNWELSDLSFLGDMKDLEGLELDECSFQELPNNITQTKLRLLDLNECVIERDIFQGIRKLTELTELYISGSDSEWNGYDIKTVDLELQRFGINLGTKFSIDVDEDTDQRILCLNCYHPSDKAIKSLAEKANVLRLANIQGGLKKFVPGIFKTEGGSMSHLTELWICDSDEIEYLVDNNNQLSEIRTLFSMLAKLKIESMKHLRALWHGHLVSITDGVERINAIFQLWVNMD